MKAQNPSALDKQCSKHGTQLGARTKTEVCKHQPAKEPCGLSFGKGQPMEPHVPRACTEEGLAPLNGCLRALLCFRKQKKTPTQIGLDRTEKAVADCSLNHANCSDTWGKEFW